MRNMIGKIAMSIAVILATLQVKAQQDPQFTQYMYNMLSVNPGYAGSRDALTVAFLHRSQWVGIKGAPKTQSFFMHAPAFYNRIGWGASVIHDRIGPIQQTFVYADFAYRISLSEKTTLAMGLKGGVNIFQPKLSSLDIIESNDPLFINSDLKFSIAPNFGFGLYLHHEKWYVGASSPRLLENKLKASKNGEDKILEKRHFFLIGGVIIPAGKKVKIKPTVQSKIVINAPVSFEGTLEALFADKVSIGAGHRWNESVSALASIHFTPQLRLGLSYDYVLSPLQQYNAGSFEAMIQYDFVYKNKERILSPRYF